MITYITQNGIKILHQMIDKASKELDEIRKKKSVAYSLSGDGWHDNPEFVSLEQAEQRKALEIAELNSKLADAVICNIETRNTSQVQIGSIVHFSRFYLNDNTESENIFEIVGFGEADVKQGKISYESPVARDILGLEIGETKKAKTPKGPVEYEIIELYPNWEMVKQ